MRLLLRPNAPPRPAAARAAAAQRRVLVALLLVHLSNQWCRMLVIVPRERKRASRGAAADVALGEDAEGYRSCSRGEASRARAPPRSQAERGGDGASARSSS